MTKLLQNLSFLLCLYYPHYHFLLKLLKRRVTELFQICSYSQSFYLSNSKKICVTVVFVGSGPLAEVSADATEQRISSRGLNLCCDCKESRVRAVCIAVIRSWLESSKILQCTKSFQAEVSATRMATVKCIICV